MTAASWSQKKRTFWPMRDAVYGELIELVEHNQNIFDTLWENAIPANLRFKEIEKELKEDLLRDNLNDKAFAACMMGDPQTAMSLIVKALQTDKNNAKFTSTKGEILMRLGKYVEAIECFDKSLSIDPNNDNALNKKRLCSDKIDNAEEYLH